jgi:hypothetical protein
MATWLRQSTAIDVSIGPFLDSADGNTVESGLTITQPDIRLKKNGGAWAQKNAAQTLSHEENGWYEISLDTTDTNTLGNLLIAVHKSGALPVWREFQVVTANVWDSFFGADKLQVHVDEMTAGIITAAVIATGAIDADAIADNAIDAGAIANGAIDAATFAAGAIDAAALAADAGTEIATAVWASGTRTLTALDEDNTTLDLDATIRAAVGLTAADLDTQLGALPTAAENADAVWDEDIPTDHTLPDSAGAILVQIDDLPTQEQIAANVWMYIIEDLGGLEVSAEQSLRISNAALAGKLSGAGTGTETVRDLGDTKDRLVYTVDNDGNRSAVTLDLSA